MVLCTRIKDKFAIWEKPVSGDPMAPYDDPAAHADKILIHSDFQYLNKHSYTTGITINHSSVSGDNGTGYQVPGPSGPASTSNIADGQAVVAEHTLVTHGLGYVPIFFVLLDGVIVANGTVVQITTDRRRMRFVSAYATATQIKLREVGISSADDLPSLSVDYDVVVIRDPAINPSDPLFHVDLDAGTIVLAKGRISAADRPLRRAVGAEATFYLPLSQTLDIRNGARRTISPSGTDDFGIYDGGMIGAEFIQVTHDG